MLFAFLKHPDHLSPFCLKCRTHKSITELLRLPKLYDVLDEYLNNFLKERISIKPDSHCLPQAVFNGIKRKGFLVGYSNYKQLFREAIFDITYNDLYLDWIADSKEIIIQELKEYEQNKNYTTNIVNIVIVALTTISKATIVAYYPDKEIVKNYIFKPRNSESKTIIKLTFINGH